MASIENYIPDTTSKKKPSFLAKAGNAFLDAGLATIDSSLGIIGQGDIITSDMYKTKAGESLDKITGITGALGNVALGIATSGLSTKILPKSFKNGGERLIDINGNSHEQGGVPLGNDEAEGGETLFDSGQSQFIFSDSMKHPIKKKETFATMSKTIRNKYKGREFDSLANKAKEKELDNLAALQESLKPKKQILGDKFEYGGERGRLEKNPTTINTINKYGVDFKLDPVSSQVLSNFFNESTVLHKQQYNDNIDYGDPLAHLSKQFNIKKGSLSVPPLNQQLRLYPDKLPVQAENTKTLLPAKTNSFEPAFNLTDPLRFSSKINRKSTTLPLNENNGLVKGNRLGENIGNQSVDFSKIKPINASTINKGTEISENTGFKNMSALPQMIGYGAQALANLPALFTKPERVKYDRVTPELINLGAERGALTQDRNLSRAISRRAASGSNNIGQALNFLGASESDLSRQFGQNISKSFQTEANLNSEIKNKAAMFNAEISKAEQDANAAEKDAARGTRLQALSNIGSATALGVKDWMDTNYKLAQLNATDTGDFFYIPSKWGPIKKEKKYNADGTWDGKSFKD